MNLRERMILRKRTILEVTAFSKSLSLFGRNRTNLLMMDDSQESSLGHRFNLLA